MNRNISEKRIPSLFAIGTLLLSILVTSYFLQQKTNYQGHASISSVPQDVTISNLTDTSFTVSYTTNSLLLGSLSYGPNSSLGKVQLDQIDNAGKSLPHYIHYFNVTGLLPNTPYYFTIASGGQTYENTNSQPYIIKTFQNIHSKPLSQHSISGKLELPDGSTPDEALIYLQSNSFSLISELINQTQNFSIPLSQIRSTNGTNYFAITPQTMLRLVASTQSYTTIVSLFTINTNPLPLLTLSNSYSFPPIQNNSHLLLLQSFPSVILRAQLVQSTTLGFTSPKKNQNFNDPQPRFEGTALPNSKIEIDIQDNANIKTETTSDSNGQWTFRPNSPLSVGVHTITIISRDSSGVLKQATEQFSILPVGSSVEGAATSSATITPLPTTTPTLIPSTKPSVTITTTPSFSISPTPTVVLPNKPTGSNSVLLGSVIGGILALFGIILFSLTRGTIPKL